MHAIFVMKFIQSWYFEIYKQQHSVGMQHTFDQIQYDSLSKQLL
jgi:hypothetical protein